MRRSRSSARAGGVAQERRALLLLGLAAVALWRGAAAGGCALGHGATHLQVIAGSFYTCAILVRLARGGRERRRGGGNALMSALETDQACRACLVLFFVASGSGIAASR